MAMDLVVDEMHAGTDERTWLGSGRLRTLPSLQVALPRRLVVVAQQGPVLTDSVLRRFWRPFEAFIEADG
jgi:hypothetical protein